VGGDETQSYIVTGGGLAGLTAANALAGAGHRVALLEQSERLGGRAVTQQERGYLLNLGPHALYRALAYRTFRAWNIPFHGNPPGLGGAAWMTCAGQKYRFPSNLKGLLRSSYFSGWEKISAARMMARMTRGDAKAGESMDQWLAGHTSSPRVRLFGEAL
jgi:phytoene dehydrogenase-like protein